MIFNIKEMLKKFFESRLFVLGAVMGLMFSVILGRVFYLQIISGSNYQDKFILKLQKSLSVDATRGNIYDSEGRLLAYNELAYSVVITDNGSYSDAEDKNEELNAQLAEIIGVLKKNGEELYNNFGISLENGEFVFNVSGTSLKRFLADVFGEQTYDKLSYNKKHGFDEANATADQVMSYLMTDKNKFMVDEKYDKETAYGIVVIRYAIFENRYSKYKTTTIAQDVSDSTVAYMNEHSDRLIGVSIEEDTIRKYNYSEYFASIIGYTGKISTEEYEELKAIDDTYTTNDIVGKSGLEQFYENYLRGKNGEQQVYIDNVGRIIDVVSDKESEAGSDIYISIDAELQKSVYLLLEQEIAGIVYSNIQSGNIPINDVYFALIDNNIIDIRHFSEEDAGDNEKQVAEKFSSAQKVAIKNLENQLYASNPLVNDSMSTEMLDYFTHILAILKTDDVLLTERIDTEDPVYKKWKEGEISPKEYFLHCITMQWIDITKLSVDDKYADTSEMYEALVAHILERIKEDKDFSKTIYRYMIEKSTLSPKQICLMLYEQGVLDYEQDTVNALKSGEMTPYKFILNKINNIEITPAQLALDPCTGSCVITDVNTGELKALVSYPGYDNNKLANGVDAEYYALLREDKSNPQWNYATQEKTAPGSTFKMVTATAGLAEGMINEHEEIECTGVFEEISNKPKCWINPSNHSDLSLPEALRDSCNIYFYTTGFRLSTKDTGVYNDPLGISYIKKYATIFGFDRKTGLEIQENTPDIADEYPVMAAIGQSNNNFTTVSIARYVTAVASGNLYDYQLMSKIVDANGKQIASYEPKKEDVSYVLNKNQWDSIHYGMRLMVENSSAFDDMIMEVAGKTGTAQQVENRPNHALFVGYAPYDNPQISIATRIAYGYSSSNAAMASKNIISYYYGEKTLEDILALKASGINSSSNNQVTD